MNKLDATLDAFPLPTWRGAAWISMLVLAAGAVWATTAVVERVATAEGVVAPQGRVRTVQHLEGGIVERILVSEGAVVAEGQPLLHIDLGGGGLNREEILVRLDALRLERARLLSEATVVDLKLPTEEAERRPDLARAEAALYSSRRREHESGLAVLKDQIAQKELEIQAIASRLQAARRKRAPLVEQREIAQKLAASNLMPRTEALQLDKEFEALEGDIAALEIELPRAQTGLGEARERVVFERNRFRNASAEQLRAVETEIARRSETLDRADAQELRTVITSPIAGVVKNPRVTTLGGVLAPGDPILEVVPLDENLVVEAQLSPNDVGHVKVGQRVRIKVATYDYMRYGALGGEIRHIAADASQTSEGAHYFRLIVETDEDHLQVGDEVYPISSGMTATVDIQLGQRTFLTYLVEPILKLRDEAFRDR